MWILNQWGAAVDLDKMCYLDVIKVRQFGGREGILVRAHRQDVSEEHTESYGLFEFSNETDAKAYIADLVNKLNGDTPEPDLRAITGLNDLVHIRDELKIIYDALYPPEHRDTALTHTKELISYVESLIAEIEGDNHND